MRCSLHMSLIAFDDTDSAEGMCTSYLMALLIREIEYLDLDIIGYPRLVRLNPNIPYKTRGNGALCVEVGEGAGERFLIGRWEGKLYFAFTGGVEGEKNGDLTDGDLINNDLKNSDLTSCDLKNSDMTNTDFMKSDARNCSRKFETVFKRACLIVEEHGELDQENTHPGVVAMQGHPHRRFYEHAVRDLLSIHEAEEFIEESGGVHRGFKSGRGIIGAAAACSWTPVDRTFEIIKYRYPGRFGTVRDLDEGSVIEMDRNFQGTFDNYDHRNRHIAISPSSPCPILFGIRGEKPAELLKAAQSVRAEESPGFIIFETNQGTDDHLQERCIRDIQEYESVILKGEVIAESRTLPGGHVVFTLSDDTGEIDCTAYEPTKEFRDWVRALGVGDELVVCGGVRQDPFTVNLEKLQVIGLAQRRRKLSNPVCGDCGISMKSIGRNQGYRCRRCGRKVGEEEAAYEIHAPDISPGWYEVPVCARRHLAKPLERMGQNKCV